MKAQAGLRVARRLMRYGVTGGAAAIVDLGGFVLLLQMAVATAPAAALSFCIAAIFNFLLSSRYAFGHRLEGRRFPLFFLGAVAGCAVNTGLTLVFVELFGLPPAVAKTGGIGIAFLFNFAINAWIIFPDQQTEAHAGLSDTNDTVDAPTP